MAGMGHWDPQPAKFWARFSSVRDLHPAGKSPRHLGFSVIEII